MAVYTQIDDGELRAFVADFDIGALLSCDGIAQGIENSNFRLRTGAGSFILTLYEKRVRPEDLPFYLDLMNHLAAKGFPCPTPITDRQGTSLHTLSERPAAIVTFLEGDWPQDREISVSHCHNVGAAAAQMHLAGLDFPAARANDLSVSAWRSIFTPLRPRADELRPGIADWIDGELTFLERYWPSGLPMGIVHMDLFPDNVFFKNSALSGVIDFYFACTDMLAIDLAVCLNAWCFGPGALFAPDRARALTDGYQAIRPLTNAERGALPVLARGMAMRFLLTRLHDWFHTPENALTRRKDPRALVPLIEFHRSVSDSTAYGVN